MEVKKRGILEKDKGCNIIRRNLLAQSNTISQEEKIQVKYRRKH